MYRMSKNLEQKIQKQKYCNRKHMRKKEMYKMKEFEQKIQKKTALENTENP